MSENQILVPKIYRGKKVLLEGKEFPEEGYKRTDKALRNCQDEGYQAVFMPQLIDTRIKAPENAGVWEIWYTAPSIRATGKTKQGTPVVVYAHIPNYFSNPDNIKKAINQGLVNWAGRMPQEEFQKLLDLEDNESVFIVDYHTLRKSPSDVISLSKALKHPQTIPFLGGEERAEKYLKRHKEVYGNNIGIWHSGDLSDQPLARLLCLGYCFVNSLLGHYDLGNSGHFLGVKSTAQKQLEEIV